MTAIRKQKPRMQAAISHWNCSKSRLRLINGESVPQWQALALRAGDVLAFGTARTGVRAYLALIGGIDVPLNLGT